jgi:hypothetical protein
MSFRITNVDHTAMYARDIPISATVGTRANCGYVSGSAALGDLSFTCSWLCEHSGASGQATIWETYTSGGTSHFGLIMDCDGSGNYTLRVNFKNASNAIGAGGLALTGFTPGTGRWLHISFFWRDRASAVQDYIGLIVRDPLSGTVWKTSGTLGNNTASIGDPRFAALGNKVTFASGSNRNTLGIVIPAIVTGLVFDGSTIDGNVSTDIASLASRGLTWAIEWNSYANCIWACNFVAGNRTGADARAGTTLTTGNMYGRDTGATFPNYHQSVLGCAVLGTIYSVNPYLYGGISYPAPTDVTVGTDSLPATALTLAASGRRGRAATKLAGWINDGAGSGQLRVGVFGNSRAVISIASALRLSDGTFPGRTMMSNFGDMGFVGQAGLWNNGRIIGGLFPLPSCQWSGTNALEGAYGPDCSAALPRCLDSGGASVNPSAVLTSLVNSTLGSRFTLTSRTSTTVPSNGASADNYRGCGCGVRLSPGCTYRIMIRAEAGLPVTDPLEVKLHILNYPASSPIASGGAKKVVASSQSAAEDSSSALAAPGLGASSASAPPTAKAITAVSAASLTNQVTHSSYGYVTVDDSDSGFSGLMPIEVGDMVQLQSSTGLTSTYNEAWIVKQVTGAGTDTCNIYYEWLPRQAPIVGDKITYVKSSEILYDITANFSASEVASGKWRGIEIKADTTGDGIILWGLEFRNTTRDGVFVVPIGRSGCGAWIQAARWPRVEDADGVSMSERLFSLFDLDVFVATTADQGTAGGYYVNSFDTIIDYVQADTPTTEIVVYSTGPEWAAENTADKQDAGDKYDWAAAMQKAAVGAGVAHTAYLFSRYTSALSRMVAGDDTTEGPTHPSTVLDITFLGDQLGGLQPASSLLAHGMSRRTRSPLRARGR